MPHDFKKKRPQRLRQMTAKQIAKAKQDQVNFDQEQRTTDETNIKPGQEVNLEGLPVGNLTLEQFRIKLETGKEPPIHTLHSKYKGKKQAEQKALDEEKIQRTETKYNFDDIEL